MSPPPSQAVLSKIIAYFSAHFKKFRKIGNLSGKAKTDNGSTLGCSRATVPAPPKSQKNFWVPQNRKARSKLVRGMYLLCSLYSVGTCVYTKNRVLSPN